MTQPRQRIPGATLMLTRTVFDRRFLLCPGEEVNAIVLFCLHVAAQKIGVEIHDICVMSNHIHVVVTVPHEFLSEFTGWFHSQLGRCLLAYYRDRFPDEDFTALWAPEDKVHETILTTKEAILDKMLYVFTNPVEAGLVQDYRKWPGGISRPADWLRKPEDCPVFKRPRWHFTEHSNVPEHVSAIYTIPPAFQDEDPVDFTRTMEAMIRDRQEQLRKDRGGRPYLGVKAILRTHPLDKPSTPRKKGKKGNIIPTIAAGGDTAALQLAKKATRVFRYMRNQAWLKFNETGFAIFPGGTYLMHHRFHMPREEPDFSWCLRVFRAAPS